MGSKSGDFQVSQRHREKKSRVIQCFCVHARGRAATSIAVACETLRSSSRWYRSECEEENTEDLAVHPVERVCFGTVVVVIVVLPV
jgi:hypothetical protein